MNIRSRLLPLLTIPLALMAGCTSYYRNIDACKERMHAEYPDAATAPLKVTGSGAAIHGTRVVVHGTIKTPATPPATRTTDTPAAAECTFTDNTLTAFQWLAPAKLVPKPQADDDQ